VLHDDMTSPTLEGVRGEEVLDHQRGLEATVLTRVAEGPMPASTGERALLGAEARCRISKRLKSHTLGYIIFSLCG
jgi:hypothetical protein